MSAINLWQPEVVSRYESTCSSQNLAFTFVVNKNSWSTIQAIWTLKIKQWTIEISISFRSINAWHHQIGLYFSLRALSQYFLTTTLLLLPNRHHFNPLLLGLPNRKGEIVPNLLRNFAAGMILGTLLVLSEKFFNVSFKVL